MKWVVVVVFGIAVAMGLYNGFMYAIVKVRHWYKKKVIEYRQRHHLPGNKVHRPKRIKKEESNVH
jgi:hypothetical protein